ncbi:MAG TPA: serine hydrolase domain-containing protein [Gaiellales bacterium]|jgi:CubicO group peptidase (beta-lactamase class C family)
MASPLELARAWVDDGVVPGVAVCVVDGNGVLDELYAGVRTRDGDVPVDRATRFALASLTKPLTAAASLAAVEEELLSLDDEVRDGFSLRHLLSHCSGLPADAAELDGPLLDPPGTYRRYSNAGYALAARLVEQAAGMPFREYLHGAVIEPLGLDASLGLEPGDASRTAIVREPGIWEDREPFFNSPSFRAAALAESGGYASARGYGGFLTCLLAGGRARGGALLARETVADMLSTQFGALPGTVAGVASWDACTWGLGLDVRGTREPHWTGSALAASANTHFGSSGTLAWIDRERGIGLVALANRGSYSGWWSRPGGWADLTAAVVAAFSAR